MDPNKVDERKGKAGSRSQDLSPQEGQEGMLSLEDLAAFGVSAEDYEQDREARQSHALRKALARVLPVSSSPSKGCLPAQSNLGISEEDIEEDRQVAKDLTSLQNKPAPARAPPRHHRPVLLQKAIPFLAFPAFCRPLTNISPTQLQNALT